MPIGQLLIEGLAIGACYGLFGIAVVIIYKTSEVVNFAQGEMGMFATFVAYHILVFYHYPFWLAFVITMIFAVILGVAIEFFFLRPAKKASVLGMIVLTLGQRCYSWGWPAGNGGQSKKTFLCPGLTE